MNEKILLDEHKPTRNTASPDSVGGHRPAERTARDTAVQAQRDRDGKVSRYLRYLLEQTPLSPVDRALARELALGAVRRRATLDTVIRAYLKHPDKRLPTPTREILQVAIYQILFLDHVPAFAAVDEAVQQAERFHHKRQQGFINGLLRTLLRELPAPAPERLEPARDAVPCGDGRSRRLGRDVFADPTDQPVDYLAAAYSLPRELARRWRERFGPDQARKLAEHAIARPPLIARINRLRGNVASVLASLKQDHQPAQAHDNAQSVVLLDPIESLTGLSAFRDGLLQPQDPTATAVVASARAGPGDDVLDFCAAPGTKATHLAERMDNQGRIVAVDVNENKLRRIETNARRLGVEILSTHLAEEIAKLELQSFDLVLVDAPCSNTGVLARRPEARWRFEEEGFAGLLQDQFALLLAAAEYVKPGGQLLYSTCSIEPEENEQIVEKLLTRLPRFHRAGQTLTLPAGRDAPQQWHDGGYRAMLEAS